MSDHELPRSAEEIDVDRLVWDPAYRGAVRHLLKAERPVETVAADEVSTDRPQRRR